MEGDAAAVGSRSDLGRPADPGAPWSYYSMKDGRPFWMAGLSAEAHDPATGEVADTYTVIITDANAAMRVHDRMPVILARRRPAGGSSPVRYRPNC